MNEVDPSISLGIAWRIMLSMGIFGKYCPAFWALLEWPVIIVNVFCNGLIGCCCCWMAVEVCELWGTLWGICIAFRLLSVMFTVLCANENESCISLKIALLIELGSVCLAHVYCFLHGDSKGGWHSSWILVCSSPMCLFPGGLTSTRSTCMHFSGVLQPGYLNACIPHNSAYSRSK